MIPPRVTVIPAGYVEAAWAGDKPVLVPERPYYNAAGEYVGDLPGQYLEPGDLAVITLGEAETSDNWEIPQAARKGGRSPRQAPEPEPAPEPAEEQA